MVNSLARSLRAVLVLTGLAAGAIIAAAPTVGAFFTTLDARRGAEGASPEALAALAPALTAYAPGVVGFGVTWTAFWNAFGLLFGANAT